MGKNALLIAGGGTLGTYTAKELLRLGHNVDIICPEEKVSDNEHLTFHQALVSEELLKELFKKKHYHAIVNFIHYPEVEGYKDMHKFLCDNTEQLVFVSSYRAYADLQHPITENAPFLLDTMEDEAFLKEEKYAVSKAKAEKFIREESNTKNWTIVRPVISFSDKRLDIVSTGGRVVLEGKPVYLPENVKNITAGLDWAGNSGKLIANLLFKEETLGEAYTISSAQNLTWGEVAELYTELAGTEFKWIDKDEWLQDESIQGKRCVYWGAVYDRFFDRKIDNSKVLKATGLKKEDFKSIKEGLEIEIAIAKGDIK